MFSDKPTVPQQEDILNQFFLKSLEADQGQIEQVLLNLYVNAWQAMPTGGAVVWDWLGLWDYQESRRHN